MGRVQDFAHRKQEEVQAAFEVGADVTLFAVAEGSPAAQAGLQIGDAVLRVGGEKISRTKHVFEQLRSSRSGPIAMQVRRGEETLPLSLPRVVGCEFGTLTVPNSGATTGRHKNDTELLIPTGLVRFVRDDDELAIAIGHQMGHHLIGSFRREEDEARADQLGLRIAWAAGYDVGKAPAFWDRWAAEQFWTISSDMEDIYIPHGAMSWRAPAIRETVLAIELERASGPPE